ncbi:MAG: hypothetical protein H6720_26495 [Sandaracinus sp.]|nr:hypothetical protein [Sandaracinus sp.]MCB9625042.1 hypothetical protein [Sandaracinus sp.]
MFEQIQAAATTIATYTTPTRFNSRHCMLVARHLMSDAPTSLNELQKRALDLVLARATAVDDVRKERQRVSAPALRGPRNAMVGAWASLFGAIQAVAAVPREVSPLSAEASSLVATLFPDGVGMAQMDAAGTWTSSRVLIERIDEEGLRPRLQRVVSPVLLEAVDAAFSGLGSAVGAEGGRVRLPARRALFEANAAFSYAVAAYARALAVTVDESEPEEISTYRSALVAVDTFRVVRSSNVLTEEDLDEEGDLEPETPSEPDPNAPYVPASDDPIDNPFITTP